MGKRIANYELMRIVAMFMIVLHHICVHGIFANLNVDQFDKKAIYIQSLSIFGKVGVALFIMISGYFLVESKVKFKKLISLLMQTILYLSFGFLVMLIDSFQTNQFSMTSLKSMIYHAFYPFSGYWFINAYVFLYLLIPFLNLLINRLSKKDFEKVILLSVVSLAFSSLITGNERPLGDTGLLFIPYLIGGYFKKFQLVVKQKYLIVGFLTSITLTNFTIFLLDLTTPTSFIRHFIRSPIYIVRDSSVMTLLIAVLTFLLIQGVKIDNKRASRVVNYFGSAMLGAYLFHDNRIIRGKISHFFASYLSISPTSISIIYKIFLCTIITFVLSTLFEVVVRFLLKVLKKNINKLRKKDNLPIKEKNSDRNENIEEYGK